MFICNPGRKLLAYAGRHGCHPVLQQSAIIYHLRDRVSTATSTHNHHPLSTETLRESAFVSPRSYIPSMDNQSLRIQWIIYHPPRFYSDLHTNITPHWIPTQHHRSRATRAYEQRYRRLRRQLPSERECHKASESEKRAGMKRVDFLMSHTKFLGIRWKSTRSCLSFGSSQMASPRNPIWFLRFNLSRCRNFMRPFLYVVHHFLRLSLPVSVLTISTYRLTCYAIVPLSTYAEKPIHGC